MFPPSFPSSVPCSGLPFPPRGPFGPVPPLHRYFERLRLPAARPASLRFLRLAVTSVAPLFAPAGAERAVREPGRLRVARPFTAGEGRISQVPGGPPVRALRPQTPAGPRRLAWRRSDAASAPDEGAGSREEFVSRLNHAAHALPVYASQPGLPPHHATLGSRLVASLCRAGFVLLGPTEGFGQLHDVLLLQALPGAPPG